MKELFAAIVTTETAFVGSYTIVLKSMYEDGKNTHDENLISN